MPPAAAEDTGRLLVAHLSPDTPAVDVAVAPVPPGADGPLTDPGPDLVTGLAYGAVSDPVALAPGTYAVSVRAAGSDGTVAPVLSARVEVPAGVMRTVTLSGRFADVALRALPADRTAPPAGSARVRVLAAAGEVPTLDVSVPGGPDLATALAFGRTGEYRTVAAGTTTLGVAGSTGAPARVAVPLAAGSVVTLVVLDRPGGGLTVRPVVEAAGPTVVPAGGVEAGGGTMPGAPAALPIAGAAAALLAATGRRGRALLTVGCLATATAVAAPMTPAAAASGSGPVVLGTGTGPGPAAPPVRLAVPAAAVDAPLAGVRLDATGALVPPADPAVAGWYTGGPVPGSPGPAVIAGHVDWAGAPGVFAGLAGLRPGTEIVVGRADGSTVTFIVTRVVRRAKNAFPSVDVYAPTAGAELRLITCGGAFDRAAGSYEDNVIVFAQAG
ncbi:class F sortase [Blastococcus deserti]|uniref:Class F sortase n=1 Tax=Blastococcus deserti TaxID=2259033 RepID=A0ABW4X645_9ACTN